MKRILDIIIIIVFFPLFVTLFICISLLVLFFLGRPVFFSQTRIGKNNQPFKIFKFRTMKEILPESKNIEDRKRINYFGRFIRSTSLDELPEILNILRKEMSFVGPRPLLPEYLPLYNKEQIKRHEVLPGITGLAQINGRNAIDWDKKFHFDLQYVNNHNIFLDIKIILITIIKIFSREGITSKTHITSEKFKGNEK